MHEIVILLIIAIIVGVQIKVFLDTAKKINLFKAIIPSPENFETVKVFIPESQIKQINSSYVLSNLQEFQNPLDNKGIENKETIEDHEDFIDDHYEETIPEKTIIETIDYESLIWISKGNEEKKIKLKLLKSHEMLGWNRIQ